MGAGGGGFATHLTIEKYNWKALEREMTRNAKPKYRLQTCLCDDTPLHQNQLRLAGSSHFIFAYIAGISDNIRIYICFVSGAVGPKVKVVLLSRIYYKIR